MPIQTLIGRFIPLSFLSSRIYDILAESTDENFTYDSPRAPWVNAKKDDSGRFLPQSIAHRGFKARYPENTLLAFRSAIIDAGADGLETDIHLTRDGVVVLSHDGNLKRCFGREEKIVDVDYSFLRTIRTIREPRQSMPRLDELLSFMAEDEPGREDKWLLLDIKMDNDAALVMKRIAETIRSIKPHPKKAWEKRIVMGVWAQKYLPLCKKFVPEFPICYIGFSTKYAQRFLRSEFPNVGFNMLTQALYLDPGFIEVAHAANRPVLAWTVNKEDWMRWCIGRQVDAVITDDPAMFNDIKKQWVFGQTSTAISWRAMFQTLWLRLLMFLMNALLARRIAKTDKR